MTVKRVGILGSGIMGSGIAETVAKAGLEVVLRSRHASPAHDTRVDLERGLHKQVSRGKLDAAEAELVLARVKATADLADLAECDLVIESVVEDLDVKKALF